MERTTSPKYGLETADMATPMVRVAPVRIARATPSSTYPVRRNASRTAVAVVGFTLRVLFSTLRHRRGGNPGLGRHISHGDHCGILSGAVGLSVDPVRRRQDYGHGPPAAVRIRFCWSPRQLFS